MEKEKEVVYGIESISFQLSSLLTLLFDTDSEVDINILDEVKSVLVTNVDDSSLIGLLAKDEKGVSEVSFLKTLVNNFVKNYLTNYEDRFNVETLSNNKYKIAIKEEYGYDLIKNTVELEEECMRVVNHLLKVFEIKDEEYIKFIKNVDKETIVTILQNLSFFNLINLMKEANYRHNYLKEHNDNSEELENDNKYVQINKDLELGFQLGNYIMSITDPSYDDLVNIFDAYAKIFSDLSDNKYKTFYEVFNDLYSLFDEYLKNKFKEINAYFDKIVKEEKE